MIFLFDLWRQICDDLFNGGHMAKPDLKKQFDRLETELLTHKYHYYILNSPIITDYEYDMKERRFFEIGAELGIDMDSYPHWIDFDYNHPKALNIIEGIERSPLNES